MTPNVSAVGALVGDPAQAALLLSLLDGRALPAGELAYAPGVTAQTVGISRSCSMPACSPSRRPRATIALQQAQTENRADAYFEAKAQVRRAISIIKKRAGRHEDTIREYIGRPIHMRWPIAKSGTRPIER